MDGVTWFDKEDSTLKNSVWSPFGSWKTKSIIISSIKSWTFSFQSFFEVGWSIEDIEKERKNNINNKIGEIKENKKKKFNVMKNKK